MISIHQSSCKVEQESFLSPFGFKGGILTEAWQTIVRLESGSGKYGVGLGVQSVLWSDPQIFIRYGEAEGNRLMLQLTRFALQEAEKMTFDTPFELLDTLLPAVYEYGKELSGYAALRQTFALNALVPVDHAAWLLYARENNCTDYIGMIPPAYRRALPNRQRNLAAVPLISYGTKEEEIESILNHGSFVLKIKLGADPELDGDLSKMLEWDKQRLSSIHRIAAERDCKHTDNGRIAYYLDANGRYDSKDRVMRLLDHADRIGALDRILLFEEPFAEQNKINVADIPVTFAADESVHDQDDAWECIQLGYRAMALKPIAKTLSMSLKVAEIARTHGVACFCADLTVNPYMVDWNKNVAAHLDPLQGMKIGLIESNGAQNYRNWSTMMSYHPVAGATWTEENKGLFCLDDSFYERSGGIYEASSHYESNL
ncbi:enolase C-terminal domain-like protein [Paenibacillus sp. GCM10027626]|uniref:enolase C-terminal domain-like protein n=1 Tax=Paenibacillus sp. GCM10027626 TaxID=3273411 RepID=UPI003645DDBC